MQSADYCVRNKPPGTDLNLIPGKESRGGSDVDSVTTLEILEHLASCCTVLRSLQAPWLFVTAPLRLWFARACRNEADPWNLNFHEFEDWQCERMRRMLHGASCARRSGSATTRSGCTPQAQVRRFAARYYAVEPEWATEGSGT